MEGKPISYNRSVFTALFIFALLVQVMVAEKVLLPGMMLPGRVLSCPYYGEYCDMNPANWCCPGTECSNSYAGGTCIDDPWKSCKPRVGDSCGFFDAKCCGKMVCTSTMYGGECQDPASYAYTTTLELPNFVLGSFYN